MELVNVLGKFLFAPSKVVLYIYHRNIFRGFEVPNDFRVTIFEKGQYWVNEKRALSRIWFYFTSNFIL